MSRFKIKFNLNSLHTIDDPKRAKHENKDTKKKQTNKQSYKTCSIATIMGSKGGALVRASEHSPPTNVARVRILVWTPHDGWVCFCFSLAPRGFFQGTPFFSFSLKTNISKFQFYLEGSDTCSVAKQITIYIFFYSYHFEISCVWVYFHCRVIFPCERT